MEMVDFDLKKDLDRRFLKRLTSVHKVDRILTRFDPLMHR